MVEFLHKFLVQNLGLFSFLMESHGPFFLEFSLGVFVLQVLLFSLQVVDLRDEFFILAHDALIISLMQLDALLELFFESLDSGLEMRTFLDELLLLVDAFHLLLVLFLDVFAVDLYNLGLEAFVVLNKGMLTLM